MSRYTLLRFVDTYFRHRVLFLVPLLLMGGLGLAAVSSAEPTYRSAGSLIVDTDAFYASTGLQRGGNQRETPSGFFTKQINGVLQTDAFLTQVASDAGIPLADRRDAKKMEKLRETVFALAEQDNLLIVEAQHEDPQVAQRLASAVIDRFFETQVDAGLGGRSAAERFYSELTDSYREEVIAARAALAEYARQNPEPLAPDATRPLTEQVTIDQLTAEVQIAEDRLREALRKEDEARLATTQAATDIRQRLQLIDEPAAPVESEGRTLRNLVVIVLFLVMGTVGSVGAVVAVTALDRIVRRPADLTSRLGVDVLAELPLIR
jgi:uncharacterized protein involved in exopolysaccharide biosynthesis